MIEFDKLDAALFAIDGFISRLISHGDNIQHAEYYYSMVKSLRVSIARDRFDETAISHQETDDEMEKRLRRVSRTISKPQTKKNRPADKGKMSDYQRKHISRKMRAYWKKRKAAEK
jgi:hypothetical protein